MVQLNIFCFGVKLFIGINSISRTKLKSPIITSKVSRKGRQVSCKHVT